MWEKIVLNLLSNAFKFTFQGSISVRFRIVEGAAELEVRDTGIGIAEHELPRLFERFHRIEGARSRSHEGSGIGLALVHELVRLHGGDIRVRSKQGEGTAFAVRMAFGVDHLPKDRIRTQRALQSTAVAAEAYVEEALRWVSWDDPVPAPLAPPGSGAGTRARILIADDNADMRDYVTRLLREHWDVEAVGDGERALASIRRRPPDLILSDVMMPGLDGFALMRAVRRDATLASIPVVLLSARAGEEATAEGLSAGADDYIAKPFTARELLVRIAARLASTKLARELDERQRRLYRHFLQAPFPIVVMRGPEFIVDLANDGSLEAWGKGPEIIGKPIREALPELEGQPFSELLERVYQTGQPYRGRGELVRVPVGPGGALVDSYWNYLYEPIFDENGRIDGIICCAFDVTEQVTSRQRIEAAYAKAEEASRSKDLFLRRAEHLQATATELVRAHSLADIARGFDAADKAAPLEAHGCFLLLREGDSLRTIAATANMVRKTETRSPPLLLSADNPLAAAARNRAAVWLASTEECLAQFPALSASYNVEVEGRAAIPLVVGEETIGVLAVGFREQRAFDANERQYLGAVANLWAQALHRARLAEAERDSMRRVLEAEASATRKKDEFLAMLGHELRNPLAPIVTATSLMRVRGRATSRELEILERQSRHISRLVDDLLDISRITSGKLSLKRAHVELADVVAQAIESTSQAFNEKSLQLYTNIARTSIVLDGDRERLVQVVTNILVNAAKFTPAGKAVYVAAGYNSGEAEIEVRDEGDGIAPELLPRVFDIFTQGRQGSDRRTGGLGLGLAIARSIVAAHGGRIEAASPGQGRGASFRISLPLLASPSVTPPSEAPEQPPASAQAKRRVLVVDDNADSAEMLAEYLGEIGYQSLVALDALQALAIVRAEAPDAAILDIGLPGMDGYELARTISQELGNRSPRLIALTGYAQASDRDQALERGFVEHLAKPVEVTKLARILAKLLAVPTSH